MLQKDFVQVKLVQTYTCGGSDGVRAGDEGLAVVQADENIHSPVKRRASLMFQ